MEYSLTLEVPAGNGDFEVAVEFMDTLRRDNSLGPVLLGIGWEAVSWISPTTGTITVRAFSTDRVRLELLAWRYDALLRQGLDKIQRIGALSVIERIEISEQDTHAEGGRLGMFSG